MQNQIGFWTGIIIGLFIGANVGLLVAAWLLPIFRKNSAEGSNYYDPT